MGGVSLLETRYLVADDVVHIGKEVNSVCIQILHKIVSRRAGKLYITIFK